MYPLIAKYLATAAFIILISEVAKRTEKFGALLTALPLVALLTLVWLYIEKQPVEKIADYSTYTFWYVLPTLPLFLIFPALLPRVGFWLALLGGILVAFLCYGLLALLVRRFGIVLF
jgi:hypothetical protein